MSSLEITEARVEDADSIADLYPHWGLERAMKRIINSLLSNNEKRYVARVNSKVVAHLLVRYGTGSKSHVASLYSLIVAPAFRNRGIATQLLRHALENMPKRIRIVLAQVRDDNKASMKVFKKLGFVRYGYLKDGLKENNIYKNTVLLKKEIKNRKNRKEQMHE